MVEGWIEKDKNGKSTMEDKIYLDECKEVREERKEWYIMRESEREKRNHGTWWKRKQKSSLERDGF